MSSREIAELTFKDHHHVCRDIRHMLSHIHGGYDEDYAPEKVLKKQKNPDLDSGFSAYQCGVNGAGQPVYEYHLDRTHTYTLVASYRADLRFKIIQRWQELETQAQQQVPVVPCQAARLRNFARKN